MILFTLKAKKYFQTININDSVRWVKYAVWSDRSTYCYLEIYELWAFISGRQFLATKTKVKVKWKSDMDNYLNISSLIAFEDSTWPLPKSIKIFCLNSSSTSLTMERQVANPVEGTWSPSVATALASWGTWTSTTKRCWPPLRRRRRSRGTKPEKGKPPVLVRIFLTETKCKIRLIYVGFNCKRKKWGKKCLEIMTIKGGGSDA